MDWKERPFLTEITRSFHMILSLISVWWLVVSCVTYCCVGRGHRCTLYKENITNCLSVERLS